MKMIKKITRRDWYCVTITLFLYAFMKAFAFLLSLIVMNCNAQDLAAFNKVYTKVYLEIAPKDIHEAFRISDSLYSISKSPVFQARSLMLSASLYQQTGDINKSIDLALQSEKTLQSTNDYSWKSRTYGFLATQYRFLKLYQISKNYAEKAIEENRKIEDSERANGTIGLIYQELAYTEIDQQHYKQAEKYVLASENHLKKVAQNQDALQAHNKQLLGLIALKTGLFDDTLVHYKKGLELTNKSPDFYVRALIYIGMAQVYIKKKDLKTAKNYLDQAEKIGNKSDYLEVKKAINETFETYYAAKKDLGSMLKVTKNKDSITKVIDHKAQMFLDREFNQLEQKNGTIQKDSSRKNVYIGIFAGLLMIAGLLFGLVRRKQKRDIEHFQNLIARLKTEKMYQIKENNDGELKIVDNPKLILPAETEQRLLTMLDRFEDSDLFTQNAISLSSLSAQFGTNTKYLSYVINKHKEKSFQHYINSLRVQYIILKLETNPIYKQYKIAALADEAGFSSPNKFSMVFKKLTSISPSQFIKYLDEDKPLEISKIG